ncbi:MAG: cyclic pyranopterin monophosphate synthase MoaC [Pseudomonadales bacterium]|nr:cyclic pyranopterin monophosphate synthase MoaC [Pseudomonadales bacterium]
MVDLSEKADTIRSATARVELVMSPSTLDLVSDGRLSKGDVFAVARVAGIQAMKRTSDLIPLCHPLSLTDAHIGFTRRGSGVLEISSSCKVYGKTGVEMEALTGASIAALTIYDMCKSVEKGIHIQDLRLTRKSGGKSGEWKAE